MVKYYIYNLFVKTLSDDENLFISGNSKKSREIIDCLRAYPLKNVYYNWKDKQCKNIVIHYDKQITLESAYENGNTLYLFIGESTDVKDAVYTILSGYYKARSKVNDDYCYLLCI